MRTALVLFLALAAAGAFAQQPSPTAQEVAGTAQAQGERGKDATRPAEATNRWEARRERREHRRTLNHHHRRKH